MMLPLILMMTQQPGQPQSNIMPMLMMVMMMDKGEDEDKDKKVLKFDQATFTLLPEC